MTSRQLAEVEQIIARIMADQDLTPTQRLLAQRDTWCEQAYQTAMAIRRIYRRVAVMRDSAPPWVRPALTAVLDELIQPALVDTMPPTFTAPASYVGRRRADNNGAPLAACPDPGGHDRLERDPAQEWRLPAQVPPGHCGWCGGAR